MGVKIEFDAIETQAIMKLAIEKDMSPRAVVRQALRMYQDANEKIKNGETCTWSGDAERAQAFAGGVLEINDESIGMPTDGHDGARPHNCRSLLRVSGQAYPKSSCIGCGASVRTGLKCPYGEVDR